MLASLQPSFHDLLSELSGLAAPRTAPLAQAVLSGVSLCLQ